MLDWLEPRCPLDTAEKTWTEFRMRWLADNLGLDRLLNSEMILPEPRFFPEPYSATPRDAEHIFARVCGYMSIDPDRFELAVLADNAIQGAAGLYQGGERPRIYLAMSQLSDPERLVATIAHELAHDILLGGGLITVYEPDHEQVTDLVPVCLGLGLFAANSPVRDRNFSDNAFHYFRINKQGYLPSRMIGYALAVFAYVRGETRPAWARYLRLDAARPLKTGLRYLLKTGDSLLHPETARRPVEPPSEANIIHRLTTGSPTVRAVALWDVAALDPPRVALVDAVVRCLDDGDEHVQSEAARVLPQFGEAARCATPQLLACLASSSATVRARAATALAVVGGPTDEIVGRLIPLLSDLELSVIAVAAEGLRQLAPAAAKAIPALIDAMRTSAINCWSPDILADAVVAIDPPAQVVQRLLDPLDSEIRELILDSLRMARSRTQCSVVRDARAR